ncbi:hypothetical protein Bca4012_076302 [Brassica carinata]|uniref:Uncharacterized protein n=1 Tax=Brassica carinata TaxID=52824 RepID=A0A8X7QDV1_BRACI|nr:hypothetical protein Bca52824_073332 [Brassica carinata]
MTVVHGWLTRFETRVNVILSSADRDNLSVLNLGPSLYHDMTTSTLFKFLHDLSEVIPNIL